MADRRSRWLLPVAALLVVGAATWALWPREANVDNGDAARSDTSSMAKASETKTAATPPPVTDRKRIAVPGDERLDPTRLCGRVERPDATPVADAEVRLLRRDADAFRNFDRDYDRQVDTIATLRTDAAGGFAFAVARGVLYRLQAKVPGAAVAQQTGCAGGQWVVLTAAPGHALTGIVRNQDDQAPIADASVRLLQRDGVEFAATRTRPDGSFWFGSLPAGPYELSTRARGHAEDVASLDLASGRDLDFAVQLRPGCTLHGTVRDAITQDPIAGALVTSSRRDSNAVTSDADGHFVLSEVDRASMTIVDVRAAGYARACGYADFAAAGELDFALRRGNGVRGRVLGADRRPLPHAYVAIAGEVFALAAMEETDWLRAKVASDGTFATSSMSPGAQYWLYVRAYGHGTRTYVLPCRREPGQWLDVGEIQLAAGGVIEGTVQDQQGQPVANKEVTLDGQNSDWGRLCDEVEQRSAARNKLNWFTSCSLTTDRTGRFRFAGLAAGIYRLRVVQNGKQLDLAPVTVADGQVLEGIRFVLDPPVRIAGRLRLPANVPPDAPWRLMALGSFGDGRADVAADGTFTFEGLTVDRYRIVMVDAPAGWAMLPVSDVVTGRSDLELTPVRAASITGCVVNADGRPVRAEVTALGHEPGLRMSAATTGVDGRFQLWVVPDQPVSVRGHRIGELGMSILQDHVQPGADLVLKLK